MRRVRWSDPAREDLIAVRDYIAADNPEAAERIAERLLNAGNSLDIFPNRGRLIARGVRQLSTVYPYLIRYRVTRDSVEIISVRHGAHR